MDWMGDRLRNLIAEGQRSLGKEVVVYGDEGDAQDGGFEDDGEAGWADEAGLVPGAEPTSPMRSGHRGLGSSSMSGSLSPSWTSSVGRSRGHLYNSSH